MARTNSAKIIARPSVSLKTQFDVLSKECMKIDDDFTHALAHIHDVLARAFMLYINLERQPAVLVAIYKKDGVKPSSRKDGSKFTPFIKALFRLDLPNPSEADKKRWNLQPQSMKNRVSIYAAALDELDAEYTVRPKDFRTNPEAKFKQLIKDNGGLIGAANRRAQLNDNIAKPTKPVIDAFADEVAKSKAWLEEHSLSLLKSTVIGSATLSASIKFGADGVAACVLAQGANGQVQIRAASNDNTPIDIIARAAARRLTAKDPSLSMLAEIVATQSFPAAYCPEGSRAKLSGRYGDWHNRVYLEKDETAAAGPACRRLVVRQNDILLSAVGTNASVATLLKPSRLLTGADFPTFLDFERVRLIEDWLQSETMVARTAMPVAGLRKPPKGHTDRRILDVKNEATGMSVTLNLERVCFSGSSRTTSQPDFNPQKFMPTWSFTATQDWFHTLRDKCLTPWFSKTVSGAKLNRPAHWLFDIKVTKSKLVIGFEHDASGDRPEEDIDLESPATLARAQVKFHVSTKDFAPAFYNLADFDLRGSVNVSGDDTVLLLQFATAIGEYTIAIPTTKPPGDKVERNQSPRMSAYP